jgi:hypothetical protein
MTVINMPVDYTDAEYIELADEEGYFWKQLIPMNYSLDYKGRKLKFDETYLRNIKKAFEENALGQQTAFQLANDDNEHDTAEDRAAGRHFDPKRYNGEVSRLAINNRGLFGRFKLTKEGTKLIDDNKKLGVSVSLRENYPSHNGQTYPVVMRHVLGTLDPKIRNMDAWQKEVIALTNDKDEEVIDLTTAAQPADTDTPPGDGENVSVSKAEYERMQSELKEYKDAESQIESWLEEEDDNESDETSLSNQPQVDPQIIALSNKVAKSEWNAERANLMRAGVPGAMLDLATPVMEDGYGAYDIELSNNETVDSKDLIRKILNEAKGYVDLAEEQGHSLSKEERDAETNAYNDFEKSFMNDLF